MNDQPSSSTAITGETTTLLLAEEAASVTTRHIITGKVRVRTAVETFEHLVSANVEREMVEVTRVPCDRMVEQRPEIRTDGDVTIVPVVEEVLVVEKRLLLKEELHIRRRTTTDSIEQHVPLRRQTAIVERFDAAGHLIKEEDQT